MIFLYAAAHPVELHVKDLGAFPAHVSGEDAAGGRTVDLDWGGWLRVAHIGKGCADGNGVLAVEENRTGFCFFGGSHDDADDLKFSEYWTIRGQILANVV